MRKCEIGMWDRLNAFHLLAKKLVARRSSLLIPWLQCTLVSFWVPVSFTALIYLFISPFPGTGN